MKRVCRIFFAFLALSGSSTGAWAETVLITGYTEAVHDLDLAFPVEGRVQELKVREGDRVNRGQLLMALDDRLEALKVRRTKQRVVDTSQLTEIRKRERILRRQWRKAKDLHQRNSLSQKQMEDEQLLYEEALAERKALELEKRQDQLDLEQAEIELDRKHLQAPIDGLVYRILRHVGESTSAHETVLHLADVSRVRFIGNMEASLRVAIQTGQEVQLNLNAPGGEQSVQATVIFVSPVTDKTSGVVEVRAEFENPLDHPIRPGVAGHMLVTVGAGD